MRQCSVTWSEIDLLVSRMRSERLAGRAFAWRFVNPVCVVRILSISKLPLL
jgi:hypothetical protein